MDAANTSHTTAPTTSEPTAADRTTMRAIVQHRYGTSDVLEVEEVDRPTIGPDEVLVVHDEGDFDLGRLEVKVGGGLAGHNGLRSIAQHFGTQDFLRLRIGVGRPERGDPRPLADWVLADFEPHENADEIVPAAADAVELLAAEGVEHTQVQVNRR